MDTLLTTTPHGKILLSAEGDPARQKALHEALKAFNNDHSPHHLAIRKTGAQPLELYLIAPDGDLLGGLTAKTYWQWLHVDDLWLHEPVRGDGIGAMLLTSAEIEAQRRHCRAAQLKTFSFQARGFYEKQGYRVIGQLDDYPPGQTLYWLRKELASAEVAP